MDTHALVPDVTDAALSLACGACVLVCADLRLAAARLRLGTARGFSMGYLALCRNLRHREDCLPHYAFCRLPGLPLQWRRRGRLLRRRSRLDGSHDAPYSGKISDHPRPVDRAGSFRGVKT